MRVALFTDLYPPYIGGQPNRFYELATRLAARGHDVSVHCVATDPASATSSVEAAVRVVRWPKDTRYDNPVFAPTKRGVVSTIRYAAGVRRMLRHEDVDVAYFNQWPYLHVLAAPRRARRRSAIDWCELRGGPIYGVVQRLLPRMVAGNMCVNDDLASRLSAMSGSRVSYLPSGVAVERYWSDCAERRNGFLYLGRLVDTKDLPLLVAAYGELWIRGFHQPLRVAGGGRMSTLLDRSLTALPPAARVGVELLGTVTEEEKARLLATSQVLVVSSKREGFPVVVAEAMASGLPVATVNRPENGTAHVVGRYGIGACGAPTASGLADAVEAVLAGWPAFSARGLEHAPDLHWERVVDRFLEEAATLTGAH